MRRTGACFCCLAMVALIFAAAPAKAGDNSIDVAVIVYDGVLTSDITAPLEVFGNAARKPWLSSDPKTSIGQSIQRRSSQERHVVSAESASSGSAAAIVSATRSSAAKFQWFKISLRSAGVTAW